jgi:N-acetylglutamate synthase-like GNAT family acetyltransferase
MASAKHIRPARLTDINAIYETIRENPEEVLPRSFHDIAANFDRFYLYDDGQVRGVISWQVLPVLDCDRPEWCIEIVSFSVRREDQGKGIGSLLLRHTLGALRAVKPDRIIVLTFYPEFFRRFDFRMTSKETLYQKIYQGCIHCTKHKSPLTCPEVAMEHVLKKVKSKKEKVKKRTKDFTN